MSDGETAPVRGGTGVQPSFRRMRDYADDANNVLYLLRTEVLMQTELSLNWSCRTEMQETCWFPFQQTIEIATVIEEELYLQLRLIWNDYLRA